MKDGEASGVVLQNGEEIRCRAVVSNADPQRTLLGLLEPTQLDPTFAAAIERYRCAGTVAKVNLALSGLPRFAGLSEAESRRALSGRIQIAPDIEYLERAFDDAKYGEPSKRPWLDAAIPSLTDPSLAPDGAHVMSISVQYAPYRLRSGDWADRRTELGNAVVRESRDMLQAFPISFSKKRY